MPITPAIKPEDAPDDIQRLYDRIKESFGEGEVPIGYQMMAHVEPLLNDAYMNAKKFMHDDNDLLSLKTRHAIMVATSSAMNCTACTRSHVKQAIDAGWTEKETAEILAVTATCAMYNTYYKFKDLAGDAKFEDMKPGLRAHTFQKTSLDDVIVEIINIVVSNINGCLKCTTGHVAKALQLGMTHEQIDEVVKVSAAMACMNTYHRTQ